MSEASLEEQVRAALATCYDPEIPVNIVDLGLVYGCRVAARPDGRHDVAIELTLTAPGCPMGESLKRDVERAVAALPGVAAVTVELVFEPPWDPSRMSEAARLALGML